MQSSIEKNKLYSTRNSVSVIIASFFNPFYFYLNGLLNKDLIRLKYALPSFYGLLGFMFQLRNEADSYRTVEQFEHIANDDNFSMYDYAINKILNFKQEGTELYLDLLSFLVGFVTNDWRFLFLIHGIITGIFVFKMLEQATLPNKDIGRITFILISLIIMPVWIMNGRFWLGSILFAWMVFGYINSGNSKYLLFSFFCVFIHQGLVFAPILLLIFSFFKRLPPIYYVSLYFISFLYLGIGSEFIGNALNIFSGSVADKIESYGRIDVAENYQRTIEQGSENFYIYSFKSSIKTYLSLFGIFFCLFLKRSELTEFNTLLIKISLIFFSLFNLTSTIGGLGGRYLGIAHVFGIISLLLLFNKIKSTWLRFPLIIGLTFVYAIEFRFDSEQMQLFFPFWGYLQAFIYIPEVTVLELFKGDF